jgi:hypothetical protein
MEEKLRFAIREGGRTVGAGVVAKIKLENCQVVATAHAGEGRLHALQLGAGTAKVKN